MLILTVYVIFFIEKMEKNHIIERNNIMGDSLREDFSIELLTCKN